jgi:rhodanese-related sulfurtransferase
MKVVRLSFYIIGALALFSCQAQTIKPQKLDPASFESKLNSLQNEILIDVRTQEEYSEGHLSNAVLIDFWGDDFKTQINKLDKSKPVFVYCQSGGRSAKAAQALLQEGFKQVHDLQGGMNAWVDANKKVVK